MGKNNRARRAAKAKQRRTGPQAGPGPVRGGPSLGEQTPEELAREVFGYAVARGLQGDERAVQAAIEALCQLPEDAVQLAVDDLLLEVPEHLWANGWQPAEVVRHVRRTTTPLAGRLAAALVLADHGPRDPDGLHPRWAAQLAEIEEGATVPAPLVARIYEGEWFAAWRHGEALPLHDALQQALLVDLALHRVGPLEEVLPPPGATDLRSRLNAATAHRDDPILGKVRALLAQAESTTFPAEAETFTAKAQELMTRHAIDQAALGAGPRRSTERPTTRRIPIDDPYVDAKSLLLQNVAEHNRTRAVFHDHYALSSIVGFESDVGATEVLFTSLLVQAQVALTAEAHGKPAGTRTRSRGFRTAFLVAYAVRIGERLAEINERVLDTLGDDTRQAALPVLASRRSAVDDAVTELFGELRTSRVTSGWDRLGGARGAAAADRARLGLADLTESTG